MTGQYRYREDLKGLETCEPPQLGGNQEHIHVLCNVSTPLHIEAWQEALATHPDSVFQEYIMKGLRQGFRIGFSHSQGLQTARKNMHSASQHPEVVSEFISKERDLGRYCGPIPNPPPPPPRRAHQLGGGNPQGPHPR